MLKKILIAAAIILALAVLGAVLVGVLVFNKGPDLSKYESLKNPQIAHKSDQKMLQVEATGDPNTVGMKAFALLFKTYCQNVKARGMVAPRARWLKPFETPVSEWVGLYGLPVPETLDKLAKNPQEAGFAVSLLTWTYGDVAEILHVGPYSTETPTIEKLKAFIASNGCEIAGPHEEEYLRGPGLFGKGNPDKYYTVIRYQVRKAASKIEPKKKK
ncbi:MAG: GyrI-like domain-containing protein [Candidatus Edwardsbacteria bacterium]|nr:GyrI-like domain-containing protein [Candidatus Edwardsbacteria bacterium]